jgi:hypothetical protein
MPCSYCRSRNHNINGCSKHLIDRLDSILNLGKDPVNLRGNPNWFKDINGKTPIVDDYQLVNELWFENYSREPTDSASVYLISNSYIKLNFGKVADKRVSKIKNAIRFAVLKKQFFKENNTTSTLKDEYISHYGYKVSYDNSSNRIKVDGLTEEENINRFALDAECDKNLHTNIRQVFNKKNPIYHNLIQKYYNILTSIKDMDNTESIVTKNNEFAHYLNEHIDPNDTFIKTTRGIRPLLERRIQLEGEVALEQANQRRIVERRLHEEHRIAREEQRERERRNYRERANQRIEQTRLRQEEVYRKLEEKKQNLILRENAVETTECPICMDDLGNTNKVVLRCGHQFCGDCLFTHLQKSKGSDCPCCRAEYTVRPFGWLPPREVHIV